MAFCYAAPSTDWRVWCCGYYQDLKKELSDLLGWFKQNLVLAAHSLRACCYAVPGTDVAYAATRCPVLTSRMMPLAAYARATRCPAQAGQWQTIYSRVPQDAQVSQLCAATARSTAIPRGSSTSCTGPVVSGVGFGRVGVALLCAYA
eukprot:3760013-Rhodomonas_salina.1